MQLGTGMSVPWYYQGPRLIFMLQFPLPGFHPMNLITHNNCWGSNDQIHASGQQQVEGGQNERIGSLMIQPPFLAFPELPDHPFVYTSART